MNTPESHTARLDAALAGRYAIERKLGEGGMASVYLAEDLKHERKVAIKILRPELAAVIGAERFLAEIKTTANLQHPHILPLFDSGEAEGFLYYVMPYVAGESLRERLEREGQLGVEESVRLARDVADALDYAHRKDVIHRDIKPANILLHDGRPMVADFGIALAISAAGGGRMTETGLSLGTPHYMSPEQASADRDLSARSDVYSLGCVLYEMLAGQPPHTGPSAQNILVRILTEDPRPVTDLRRTVPGHVAAAVTKAIEKLPADRFETAREFMEALDDPAFNYAASVGTGTATMATNAPPAAAIGPWLADARSKWAVGAVALMAGVTAWALLGPSSPPEAGDPVVRVELEVDDLEFNSGFPRIMVAPTGDALAFTGSVAGGPSGLHARRTDEPRFRLLPGTEGARLASFSPDGRWLVFSSEDLGLSRVSLEGGNPTTVVPPSRDLNPVYPHWGEDGMISFAGSGGLYEVSENGGEPTLVWEESVGNVIPPHRLPDGRGVLLGSFPDLGIRVYEPGADSLRVVVPVGKDPRYLPSGHIVYGHPDGGLWAVPFDLERLRVTGTPRPALDGVTGGPLALYDVARDGTLVYRTGGATGFRSGRAMRRLLLADLEAGTVDTLPPSARTFQDPTFSPDGGTLAFGVASSGSESDLYTYDMVLGGPTQLTFETGFQGLPVWSPDGTRIAFASRSGNRLGEDVLVVPVDRSADPLPVIEAEGRQFVTDWTEDDILVYESYAGEGGAGDIRRRPLGDPAGDVPFLEAEWAEVDAQVSPDGVWVAYVSSETGAREVFVRRFADATAQSRVSENQASVLVSQPRWSPDGETIYYRQANAILAARMRMEPSPVVLDRRVAFDVSQGGFSGFDVHPTEPKLVLAAIVREDATEEEAEPVRWFLVTNWLQELRARLGEGG